ncbi:C40 family peptidase [Peribacillus kribbensis]|uniref:C40 family peptidase n=1 Tax=Peribacillus kribbensis TaxID=356658 RepID=UPI00042983D8|nr:NlpC/P60 family protein [Peribacillus kribbensis]
MKKRMIKTAVATTILFSAFSFEVPTLQATHKAEAATLIPNPYNNQTAVNAKAQAIINTAKSLIGKATYSNTVYKKTYPYEFSCASYINFIFGQNGINLSTYDESNYAQMGYYVPKNQLQPGDLVFSSATPGGKINHVAMYIGNNKIIQMADPKQNICITDITTTPYWINNYITARRVLPSLMDANPATFGDHISDIAYGELNNASKLPASSLTHIGFVKDVFNKYNTPISATTLTGLMRMGTTISVPSKLRKGDLVFLSSNGTTAYSVGIYTGDTRIVYAYNGKANTRVLSDFQRAGGASQFLTARRISYGQ